MRCAADNIPNLAQVFDVYKEILESKGFLQQNGIVQPEEAALFINTVSAFQPCAPFSLPLHQQLPDTTEKRG